MRGITHKTLVAAMAFIGLAMCAYGQTADSTQKQPPRFFKNLQVETRWNGGFVMAHRPSMVYLQRKHLQGFEVTLAKPLNGKHPWHAFYRNAVAGITYQHYMLGYDNVLGRANGLYAFLRFNIAGNKGSRFSFTMGDGLVWLNKTFDKTENHKNIAIGSHINALINFQFTYEQRIVKGLHLTAGIGFTHYSNGAFSTPNLGLNMPSVSLGAVYKMYPEKIVNEYAGQDFRPNRRIVIPSVIATIGGKQVYPPDGRRYGVMNLMFNFLYPVGMKSGLLLTIDIFNDRSIPANMKRKDPTVELTYMSTVRPGIAFGHDLWLGRLSFVFQAGVYPYTKYKEDGMIYSRLGLRYLIGKNILANITLKTHFAKADNIEFGIGYVLWGNRRHVRLL